MSASGNGYIWSIDTGKNCAWACKKPCSGSWILVDQICRFKQIDQGQQYVYAVNYTNHVFSRPVDCVVDHGAIFLVKCNMSL